MADVFSTVAGALSVAALFNNCVDSFGYIQLGRHFGRDYERCQLKLDIAKTRLSRWGEAIVINEDPRFATDAPEDKPSRQIRAILEEIEQLFRTVQKSSKRYEIDAMQEDLVRFGEKDMQPMVRGLHNQLDAITSQRQKRTSLLKKAAWALYDGKNLEKLIEQVTGFVDDLEKLFPVENVRRKLVEIEIEEIDDEPSLVALQGAAVDVDSVMSGAITQKLEGYRERNYARNVESEEKARVRVGNEWIEAALSRSPLPPGQTWNEVDSIAARGTSAVHVGNSYGGRGIFDS